MLSSVATLFLGFFFLFFCFVCFVLFFMATLRCLWKLSSRPGIAPRPMAVKVPSPTHWTSKEFPIFLFFFFFEEPPYIVAAPIYIPTNSVGGFSLLHTLSSICHL